MCGGDLDRATLVAHRDRHPSIHGKGRKYRVVGPQGEFGSAGARRFRFGDGGRLAGGDPRHAGQRRPAVEAHPRHAGSRVTFQGGAQTGGIGHFIGENHGSGVGDYSHKPKWRPDGYGFGEPFKLWGPVNAFVKEMVKIALSRPCYTVKMLCDLVSRLHALAPEDQERVWEIIGEWRNTGAPDEEIAKVREKIRVTVLSRRGRRKAHEEGQASLNKKAKAVYAAMQPNDIVNKHEWLFRQDWVE